MGLAPAVLLGLFVPAPPVSFHLAFWGGLGVGLLEATVMWPAALEIGSGRYAGLLGANLWGLLGVTLLYVLPVAVRSLARGPRGRLARILGVQSLHPAGLGATSRKDRGGWGGPTTGEDE